MADLRALATEIGLTDVATYLQSGNLVGDDIGIGIGGRCRAP